MCCRRCSWTNLCGTCIAGDVNRYFVWHMHRRRCNGYLMDFGYFFYYKFINWFKLKPIRRHDSNFILHIPVNSLVLKIHLKINIILQYVLYCYWLSVLVDMGNSFGAWDHIGMDLSEVSYLPWICIFVANTFFKDIDLNKRYPWSFYPLTYLAIVPICLFLDVWSIN